MAQKDAYQLVTDRFLEALREGVIPWRRTWGSAGAHRPKNLVSGKTYQGINYLLTTMASADEWFVSFKQAKDLGGYVKRGAKGIPIVYWNWITRTETNDDGADVEREIPFVRYSTVFPLSATEGIEAPEPTEIVAATANDPISICDDLVDANDPTIVGGEPAYVPDQDEIRMPHRSIFDDSEAYYSTLFHELVHWSGAPRRLNRTKGQRFGDDNYAREELVAEIGAALLCNETGIENRKTIDDGKAYVQHWISQLESDPQLIITAAAKGRKAAEYLTVKEEVAALAAAA